MKKTLPKIEFLDVQQINAAMKRSVPVLLNGKTKIVQLPLATWWWIETKVSMAHWVEGVEVCWN